MDSLISSPSTNGKGGAAIIAVAIASLVLGIFTITGDAVPAAASIFNVWNPTGPLSGVTGLTIIVWLLAWWLLSRLWSERELSLKRVNWAAAVLITAGLLLTFPPFMDFLQGK